MAGRMLHSHADCLCACQSEARQCDSSHPSVVGALRGCSPRMLQNFGVTVTKRHSQRPGSPWQRQASVVPWPLQVMRTTPPATLRSARQLMKPRLGLKGPAMLDSVWQQLCARVFTVLLVTQHYGRSITRQADGHCVYWQHIYPYCAVATSHTATSAQILSVSLICNANRQITPIPLVEVGRHLQHVR